MKSKSSPGTPGAPLTSASAIAAPPLGRRLASLMYESVLVFAVVFFAAMAYSVLTGQRHAMAGRVGLSWVAFGLAPALYFVWYWSQTGQTLPMQTWRIQVLTRDGARLTRAHAALRFIAAWVWVLPPLLAAWLLGWQGKASWVSLALIGWMVLYALSCRLHPSRQFWHDLACGTRLVDTRSQQTATPKPASA